MPYAAIMEWPVDWATHLKIDAAIGEAPVDGLVVHSSGPCETGVRVLDVWQSREQAVRFTQERVFPALVSLGIPTDSPPVSMTEYDLEIVRT